VVSETGAVIHTTLGESNKTVSNSWMTVGRDYRYLLSFTISYSHFDSYPYLVLRGSVIRLSHFML
jgi:hypothetical protein